jgi:nicotinate-nucleotide adenylyltransferase
LLSGYSVIITDGRGEPGKSVTLGLRYHNPMQVALFGGSFDPPHLGHLAVARAAREALELDSVLFAPVGLQPLKTAGHSASFEDRVAMTGLAIADDPAFELSLIDAPEFAPNYTADTVMRLRERLPSGAKLFLLLGADSFRTLAQWHRAAELPFLASLVVASRPGQKLERASDLSDCLPQSVSLWEEEPRLNRAIGLKRAIRYRLGNAAGREAELCILSDLNYDISATELRQEIHEQPNDRPALLSPAVLAYIREHGLYR